MHRTGVEITSKAAAAKASEVAAQESGLAGSRGGHRTMKDVGGCAFLGVEKAVLYSLALVVRACRLEPRFSAEVVTHNGPAKLGFYYGSVSVAWPFGAVSNQNGVAKGSVDARPLSSVGIAMVLGFLGTSMDVAGAKAVALAALMQGIGYPKSCLVYATQGNSLGIA